MISELSISEDAISESPATAPKRFAGVTGPRGNPAWTRVANIGDVGGSLDKRDSTTEGREPYAVAWLREIESGRGSAFSSKAGSLVNAENVAMARFSSAVWSRGAEKFRANATPFRADERLNYWARVLNVPRSSLEPKWRTRDRTIAAYRAALGPTVPNIRETLARLLGDAYVSADFATGTDLDTPPANTYWPGVNPGPSDQDLGNGTWSSPRGHLTVTVTRPSGVSTAEFKNLLDVQMASLLDDMLRASSTFDWTEV